MPEHEIGSLSGNGSVFPQQLVFAGLLDLYLMYDFEEDGVYDLVSCGARPPCLVILLTYHFYRKLQSK